MCGVNGCGRGSRWVLIHTNYNYCYIKEALEGQRTINISFSPLLLYRPHSHQRVREEHDHEMGDAQHISSHTNKRRSGVRRVRRPECEWSRGAQWLVIYSIYYLYPIA